MHFIVVLIFIFLMTNDVEQLFSDYTFHISSLVEFLSKLLLIFIYRVFLLLLIHEFLIYSESNLLSDMCFQIYSPTIGLDFCAQNIVF